MSKDKKILLLLILLILGLGLRISFALTTNFTFDDAFITFRYAENLASGKGFVYNFGEQVLGTTTPLYTMLLAGGNLFGLDVKHVSLLVNLISEATSIVILFLLGAKLIDPWAGFLSSVFFCFFPGAIKLSISGMETPFYIALILLTIYFYCSKSYLISFILAGMVVLTRIEGFLLILALGTDWVFRKEKFQIKPLLPGILIMFTWFLFSYFYFGSFVPNSLVSKKIFYSKYFSLGPPWMVMMTLFFSNFFKIILFFLGLVGGIWLYKKKKKFHMISLWLLFYLLFFTWGCDHLFPWYYLPFLAVLLLLAGASLVVIIDSLTGLANQKLKKRFFEFSFPKILLGLTVLMIISSNLWLFSKYIDQTKTEQGVSEQVHKKIGLWLRENTPHESKIYTGDIGYIGYFSNRYIIDQVGKVSKDMVRYNKQGEILEPLSKYNPDFCVIGLYGPLYQVILRDEWFEEDYRQVARFRDEQNYFSQLHILSEKRLDRSVPDYLIFERIEKNKK